MDEKSHPSLIPAYRIFLVGNPGAGKSSILNLLAGRPVFRAGHSPGVGLTLRATEAPVMLDGVLVHLVDTPGIYEPELLNHNIKILRGAIKQVKSSKVLFVVRVDAGRLVMEDVALVKTFVESSENLKKVGIILNKCCRKDMEPVNQQKIMQEIHTFVFGPNNTQNNDNDDENVQSQQNEVAKNPERNWTGENSTGHFRAGYLSPPPNDNHPNNESSNSINSNATTTTTTSTSTFTTATTITSTTTTTAVVSDPNDGNNTNHHQSIPGYNGNKEYISTFNIFEETRNIRINFLFIPRGSDLEFEQIENPEQVRTQLKYFLGLFVSTKIRMLSKFETLFIRVLTIAAGIVLPIAFTGISRRVARASPMLAKVVSHVGDNPER